MIRFKIQGKDQNHLVEIEHGQTIDIFGELEQLGMDKQLYMIEIMRDGVAFRNYGGIRKETIARIN